MDNRAGKDTLPCTSPVKGYGSRDRLRLGVVWGGGIQHEAFGRALYPKRHQEI